MTFRFFKDGATIAKSPSEVPADGITYTAVEIPEPSTMGLFLIGLLGFSVLTIRSRSRQTGRGFLRRFSPALGG